MDAAATPTGTAAATATDTAAAVRSGERTARAETEAALARIAELDARLGAFQLVRAGRALAEADAVDRNPERGSLPLAGVPLAIKDNVPVAGEPMRSGSLGSDPGPQPADHEVVRRLRRAGAVVVGITRVPELCVFGSTDSAYGRTRNPWRTDLTPGGSSGGSAAAVASGAVALAHGNDGMGSIRIPAAACGLVGLKPGHGVVPSELGEGSWFGMAENGPLATTVADCALMLSVLADRPDLARVGDPGPLRIAASTRPPIPGLPVDAGWSGAVRASADALRGAGHTVRVAAPGYPAWLGPAEIARWLAGTELDARILADRTQLAPRTRRHARLGALLLGVKLPRESGRRRWQRLAERFFADHDVLMTPTLAQPPPAALAWAQRGWAANVWSNARYAPFAGPWNLAGWPAMNVPAGAVEGLPVGVQLVARPGGEALLLALAGQLERLRPWRRTAPLR